MNALNRSGADQGSKRSRDLAERINSMWRAHWTKCLLSHEEEVKVRQDFKAEREANCEVPAYSLPAGKKLIDSIQLYVHDVANKTARKNVMKEDLYQEGYLGCLDAIEKYVPDRDIRFISYAKWWVYRRMQMHVAQNEHPIRLPWSAQLRINRLNKFLARYPEAKFGQSYEDFQIAARRHDNLKSTKLSEEEYNTIMLADLKYLPYIDHSVSRRLDFDIDESACRQLYAREPSPDRVLMQKDRNEDVQDLLAKLPTRQRLILSQYYGFTEEPANPTLDDIGGKLGIIGERVRQIRNKTLEQIRKNNEFAHLADYL